MDEPIQGRRRSIVATALWFSLGAGVAYLIFVALQQLTTVLVILSLALLIALTLDPMVVIMQRKMPRWAAALIAWALTVAVLVAPVVLAVEAATDQLPTLIKSVPNLINEAESHLGSLGTKLHIADVRLVVFGVDLARQGADLRPRRRAGGAERVRRRRDRRGAVAVAADRVAAIDRVVLPTGSAQSPARR